MAINWKLLPTAGLSILGLVASMFLPTGVAYASTITFTAGSFLTTEVDAFGILVDPAGRRDGLSLNLPVNSSTPEFFALLAEGKIFDATLIDSTPTENLTYDFTGATITQFNVPSSDSSRAYALVNFATSTATLQPVPLPASLWLLLTGLGGLVMLARNPTTSAAVTPAAPRVCTRSDMQLG